MYLFSFLPVCSHLSIYVCVCVRVYVCVCCGFFQVKSCTAALAEARGSGADTTAELEARLALASEKAENLGANVWRQQVYLLH